MSSRHDIVFIVGTGRAGSTILQEVLGKQDSLFYFDGEQLGLWHPHIYPYNDKSFEDWVPYYQQSPSEMCILSLGNMSVFQKVKLELFIAGIKFISRFKPVVLKSPMLTFYLPYLAKKIENSKFLILKRDDEKTVNSWVNKDFEKKYKGKITEEEYRTIAQEYVKACREYENSPIYNNLKKTGRAEIFEYESFIHDRDEFLTNLTKFCGCRGKITIPDDVFIDENR